MDYKPTKPLLSPSAEGLVNNVSTALMNNDFSFLKQVFSDLKAELHDLLETENYAALSYINNQIQLQGGAYLKRPNINREIGLWLLPKVSLQPSEVIEIEDKLLARSFAMRACVESGLNNAHFFLVSFYKQGRPECCLNLFDEQDLMSQFIQLGHMEKSELLQEMIGVMVQNEAKGSTCPEFWKEFLRAVESSHLNIIMPTWEGANLATFLKQNRLDHWYENSITDILKNPTPGDFEHLGKIAETGYAVKQIEVKTLFTDAVNSHQHFLDPGTRQINETLIAAIMVYDFKKHDDYAYTTCTRENSLVREVKARAVSYIWERSEEATRQQLVEMLDLEFKTQEEARSVKKHFNIELYRRLAVGGVDALEEDLGL